MKYTSRLSPKVKELLSTVNWDYSRGTIKSSELIELISADKTLNLLIIAYSLKEIEIKELSVDDLLKNSLDVAIDLGSSLVETSHLLLGVLKTLDSAKYKKVKKQIKDVLGLSKELTHSKAFAFTSKRDSTKNYVSNKDVTFEFSAVIKDLTLLGQKRKLKKTITRKKIEDKLISILSRKYKNSVLISGPQGSGKTSLVISLAQRIVSGKVPNHLKGASVVSVNLPVLLNSFELRDRFELGFKHFLEEKSKDNKFTIFFFDDIHLLASSGFFGFSPPLSEQFLDITNRKRSSKSKVAFIATMDTARGDRFFDSPLYDLWEILEIENPPKKELIEILRLKLVDLQKHFGLVLDKESLNFIISKRKILNSDQAPEIEFFVNLLDDIFATFVSKYDKDERFQHFTNLYFSSPYKIKDSPHVLVQSIDYQSQKVTARKVYTEEKFDYKTLNAELKFRYGVNIPLDFVKNHLYLISGSRLSNNFPPFDIKKLQTLELKMKRDIIGQSEAIDSLISSIKRSYFGLADNKKPLASMLFLGPTGVGKTETAKCLAKNLFGEKKLIRIDMSDFMERHTVARLVGSPPGYVGYGEGGQLTDFVKDNPKCVVLFDEVEKAHPDILNILLQVLEEGELTSGDGVVVNFKETVVILTSNLGAELINKEPIGFINSGYDIEYQGLKDRLLSNLKKEIKPEIINRLTDVIVFRMLNKKDANSILKNYVNDFVKKLKKRHQLDLRITKDVFFRVLNKGYSKEYGARELRRSLERNLMDKVVEFMITSSESKKVKALVKKNQVLIENM